MHFFRKVGNNLGRLFVKNVQTPHLFRKISNTAREVDNSVKSIKNFIQPGLKRLGLDHVNGYANNISEGVSNIRNGLEKAIEPYKKAEALKYV